MLLLGTIAYLRRQPIIRANLVISRRQADLNRIVRASKNLKPSYLSWRRSIAAQVPLAWVRLSPTE